MIHFEQVSYSYPGAPQPAIRNLDLMIEEGELVLVAGPSGAGKSTLLRCINGLVPHFHGGTWHGRVLVAGRDTREYEPRSLSDIVGFVFQDPEAQMVVEVVEDELVFGMENLGLDSRVMRRRVEEVLDQLEIAHLRRRRLDTLSGGERQRVAIAAVLTTQPRILVLDEPTSQLDPHAAEEVLTALQKLNSDLGLTIVLSEHRLERVVQYVDKIVFCPGAPGDTESDRADGVESTIRMGPPREILQTAPLAPPLVQVGRSLGWQPLPLTIKAARPFARAVLQLLPDAQPKPILASGRSERHARAKTTPTSGLAVAGLGLSMGGRRLLDRVDLAVEAGEIVALIGRNGSGKTTLLRTVMGLVEADSGRITVDGRDIARQPVEERGQTIGYVPQDPRALLFRPSVREELEWTLAQEVRQNAADERTRVDQVLTLLGLDALASAHPRDLSAGEQQRTALATALIRNPQVLLLDEPTRGLDYLNKSRLLQILRRLRVERKAILLVTHDVELVAACADRVILLGEGEVVTEGPTRTLLHESLIFSSQIGKLFPGREWLTAEEAIAALRPQPA